ncbi:hypothetical protein K0B96_16735 [Horticoccus luteus]|uniref:Uncharacterized protein n=1 Tax=Horticoccus luteus TaxID=2862869 RepID=A0A8F9TV94_9BACT|nr:hypothetical protein [Horticoccus luteus]QYM78928.1 hypothetical protein K0B96_16735 [Horticoccus luteus]
MTPPLFRAAAIALLLTGAGCTRPPASTRPPTPAAWQWQDFPSAQELLLAELPAGVQPVRLDVVHAPVAGELMLLPPAANDATLPANAAWARITIPGAADEARDLADMRQRLTERRDHYARFEVPAALARLDREIADAQETLSVARFAQKSPDLFRGEDAPLDPQLQPSLSPAQAEAQLQRLREQRAQLAAGDRAAEPADLLALQAQLDQRDRALRLRDEQLTLTAPFAARLRLAQPGASRHVEPGEIIATLSDSSALEVRVRATLPLLHSVPPETLQAVVTLPGGITAPAEFAGSTVELQGPVLVTIFRFQLAATPAQATAVPTAGVELPVLVFARLPHAARIVPKLALVRFDAHGVLRDGWRAGLPRLLPGTELLAEGRQALALQPAP